MANVIDGGFLPEDDPIFSGSWDIFTVRLPKSTESTSGTITDDLIPQSGESD